MRITYNSPIRALQGLIKPCYVFSPSTAIRRVRVEMFPPKADVASVLLPWGAKIEVQLAEAIGREIFKQRIFDIALSELAWRLLRPGGKVLDVGANIGYFSGLFASRVGPGGVVHGFEPHPKIYERLRLNVAPAKLPPRAARVILHNSALGHAAGGAQLIETDYFGINQGTARITDHLGEGETRVHSVTMETLDSLFPVESFDLAKIDVEGFEARVLQGAGGLLREKRIAHVLYEDHDWQHSGLAETFKTCGYTVFAVGYDFFGPQLKEAGQKHAIQHTWESPNFLASLDGGAVLKIASRRGWQVLAGRTPSGD